MKKIIGVMAVAMLLIGALIAPATAEVEAAANDQVCPEGDSGKIDTVGDPASVTVTAPEGMLIDSYCVKAGSANQGLGPEFVDVDPPQKTVEITHSSTKDVSHYSVTYVPEPEPEPEPLTLTLVKDWDVDDEDGLWDETEASYTLTLNGDAFTDPIDVEDGDAVELGEEDVTVPEACDFIGSDARTYVVDADDADDDGLITLTLTNTVVCAEVQDTPPLEQEPEVEPGEEEPEVEPGEEEPEVEGVSVEKKVEKTEVLAASATLPQTGVPALVLALLGLMAIGSGGAILRRR